MTTEATTITLRLFGPLSSALGRKEASLLWAEGTVQEALLRFVEEHGPSVRGFLFDSRGSLWRSLIVLVNDEPVADLHTTLVKAGDSITLLLPLAGGGDVGSRGGRLPMRP